MGEIIRDLGEVNLGNSKMRVEINKGTHKSGKYDIHIQNSNFRLNINEIDFSRIALGILYARENLATYKDNNLRGDFNE
ncbi:MAG: hypothetical protein LUG93_14605 [Lachnospiraceae bacterium]|nr:hypothetical protein [Lachnospiraceae bacterium]